jgi:predicted ATP-grasp superfamily ATP-dependent carboligase
VLVHEFASGGGLAGQRVPVSLGREGAAMRDALVADLAALRRHRIVATADPRFPLRPPPGVDVVTITGRGPGFDDLLAAADAVWLVAPETDGCLERLAARAEAAGRTLLGSGAAAIRRAADKAALPRRLALRGVAHPPTRVLRRRADWRRAARTVGYPLVVKPARGAGCHGVCLARDADELRRALEMSARANGTSPLLLQRYVPGVAASVSLLCDGRRAVVLTVNAQAMRAARPFAYRGGSTPLDHPLAARAAAAARTACRALPGLRGYVGVDVVLTRSEAVVIEVNPRLTTSYLGVRAALRGNVAALALAACAGELPAPPPARRHVRYTAAGRIVSTVARRSRRPRP